MDQRLKGQELSVRVIQDGKLIASIDSVSSFNEEVDLEIKSDGFLGESVNRFDEILNGFGGDMEMQITSSALVTWQQSIIDRATRRKPNLVFNVVRTDLYPNGDSAIYTYKNVFWGAQPTSVGARGEYVKTKANFKCGERPVQPNALP